jgi:hypothetical protein
MILQTSKKYKTIKHIVLCWGDRELLRYPYPIILTPLLKGFWPEEYVSEISHPYGGTSFSMYFTANYEYPMHLKTKFPKGGPLSIYDIAEEDHNLPPQPLKDYGLYFISFCSDLEMSPYLGFCYDIYSKMFVQSQIIVRNMDLDKQDLFEGVEDIKIDVSKPSYRQDVLEAQRRVSYFHAEFGIPIEDPYDSVDSYYQTRTYRYGLEESKSLFLTHLGEQNPEGYSGVNENFFKNYTLRLQLVCLFRLHYQSATIFGFSSLLGEELERISLWKEAIFIYDLSDRFLRNIENAERFYLRRFYRKFRLLNR